MININVKDNSIVLSEYPDKIIMAQLSKEADAFLQDMENKIIKVGDDDKKIDEIKQEIKDTIGIKAEKILSFGQISSNPPKLFKKYCTKTEVRRGNSLSEKNKGIPDISYKCFVGTDSEKRFGFIMHEDIKSSWNCAIIKLNNCTHAIIYIL